MKSTTWFIIAAATLTTWSAVNGHAVLTISAAILTVAATRISLYAHKIAK